MDFTEMLTILSPFIFIAFVIWAVVRNNRSKKKSAEAKAVALQVKTEQAMAEVMTYLQQVNAHMSFSPISVNLNLQKDEFAILNESSTLYEYVSHRVSTGVGTRIKVGGLPVYLGRGVSQSATKLKKITEGTLYLTNKRIVFIGDKKNVTSYLRDIIGVENGLDHITVSSSKRQKPEFFTVNKGFYWSMLVPILSQLELKSPNITERIMLPN